MWGQHISYWRYTVSYLGDTVSTFWETPRGEFHLLCLSSRPLLRFSPSPVRPLPCLSTFVPLDILLLFCIRPPPLLCVSLSCVFCVSRMVDYRSKQRNETGKALCQIYPFLQYGFGVGGVTSTRARRACTHSFAKMSTRPTLKKSQREIVGASGGLKRALASSCAIGRARGVGLLRGERRVQKDFSLSLRKREEAPNFVCGPLLFSLRDPLKQLLFPRRLSLSLSGGTWKLRRRRYQD